MVGYSVSPLATKLGIKIGTKIRPINAPEGYLTLVEPLPPGTKVVGRLSGDTDIVHIFSSRRSEIAKALKAYREKLKPTAVVWVSWPKKAAKLQADITEDIVREIALPLGFVDIKVCAVTDIWSGLKLEVRQKLR